MRTYSVHELSRLGAATAADLDTLLNSSGLTPAKAERYDEIGDANGVGLYSNRRGSQKRAKKDDSMFLRMMSSMERDVFEFDDDDFSGRRRPRGRRKPNGPDSRRAVDGDGERKPNAEDGERRPADAEADSERKVDADGERTATPEGDRAVTPEAERAVAPEADRVATPEIEPARVVAETVTPDSARVVFADTAPEVETRIGPAEFEAPRAVEVAIEPARTVDPVVRAPVAPALDTPVIAVERTLAPEFRVPATPSVIVEARPVIDLDTVPALQPVEAPVADADVRVGGIDAPVEVPRAPASLSPALAGMEVDLDIPAYEPSRVAGPDFDPSAIDMPEMRAPAVELDSPNFAPTADTPVVRVDAVTLDTPDIDTRAPDLADFFARSHNGIYFDMDTPEMRAPDLSDVEIRVPVTDAEVIRSSAPELDVPHAMPDTPSVRTATAASPWETHLQSRGTSMDAFNAAVEAPAPGRIEIGAAPVEAPHASLNAGRAGRFTRLLMPNGLDYAIIGGFATYAAIQTASVGIGDNADIELASGVGIDLNGAAIGGAAADAAPWVDAIAAKYRGRDAEATVRLIVNGVETATPFAFAAAGAWVGGATGSAGAGVGAIPGAVVGGVGGFVVGLVASGAISVAVDEGLRATARGMGYDVDRGFVSSLLAPEFAGEMEAWVSRIYGENGSLPDGASPQQIVDDILASTDDPTEQVTRFREFMGIMNDSLYSSQEEHLNSIRDIVEAQTRITDLRAVLDGDPEIRDNFLSFYQNQLEQDPSNESAQMVMTAVAEYYALQENRFSVQQAILNADIMHAVSMNEDIRDNVERTYQDMHHAFMVINMQEELVPELIEVDAQRRLQELYSFIETQQDEVNADTNSLIRAVAENGGDAYAATGSTEMLTQALTLYDDMETALSAAADRIVTTHMGSYEIFFDNYDRLEGYINEALDDYADRAPESAAELRRIIADSNGFQNLTDDQKVALAQNVVFREALQDMASEVWIFRTNPNDDLKDAFWDLEHNLDQSGYGIVMSRLGLVAHQREELETTLRRYGVDAEMAEPELDAEGPRRDPRMDPRMVGPR